MHYSCSKRPIALRGASQPLSQHSSLPAHTISKFSKLAKFSDLARRSAPSRDFKRWLLKDKEDKGLSGKQIIVELSKRGISKIEIEEGIDFLLSQEKIVEVDDDIFMAY